MALALSGIVLLGVSDSPPDGKVIETKRFVKIDIAGENDSRFRQVGVVSECKFSADSFKVRTTLDFRVEATLKDINCSHCPVGRDRDMQAETWPPPKLRELTVPRGPQSFHSKPASLGPPTHADHQRAPHFVTTSTFRHPTGSDAHKCKNECPRRCTLRMVPLALRKLCTKYSV